MNLRLFQFLDRNSFGSDFSYAYDYAHRVNVSIPRSEFFRFGLGWGLGFATACWLFQFLDRNSFGSDGELTGHGRRLVAVVSIPRSEFFRFGLDMLTLCEELARRVSIPRSEFFRFGHLQHLPNHLTNPAVSIPRSEFFRFGPAIVKRPIANANVSIPRSEFFRFGPLLRFSNRIRILSFNSSIGILSVRTQL